MKQIKLKKRKTYTELYTLYIIKYTCYIKYTYIYLCLCHGIIKILIFKTVIADLKNG